MTQKQHEWLTHWLLAEMVNASYNMQKMCMDVPYTDAERRVFGNAAKVSLHRIIDLAAESLALIGCGIEACNALVDLPTMETVDDEERTPHLV